jgi:hypothetical protein
MCGQAEFIEKDPGFGPGVSVTSLSGDVHNLLRGLGASMVATHAICQHQQVLVLPSQGDNGYAILLLVAPTDRLCEG